MASEYEIGEFEEDSSFDELDSLIRLLVQRVDTATKQEGFCGVDISGARANIAMLATIVRNHGSGHLIERTKVEEWARRIDEPFTNEQMWGFTPWPEEVKKEWRAGCRETIQKLLAVIEDI